MPGLVPRLAANVLRTPQYKMGGIATAIGFNTFTTKGANQATVDAAGKLTVAAGAALMRMEFEENTASYSDNTTIGNNRYPKHLFGFKLAGRTQVLNDMAVTLDLSRTTWALRTHTGECVILGLSNGLISEKNESGAGAGADDFNGFDVVLSGGEIAKALIIDQLTFDALLARTPDATTST